MVPNKDSKELLKKRATLMKEIRRIDDLRKAIKKENFETLADELKAELIKMGLDEIASNLTVRKYADRWLFSYKMPDCTLHIENNGIYFCAYFEFANIALEEISFEDEDLSICLKGAHKNLIKEKYKLEEDLKEIQQGYDLLSKHFKEESKPV